MQHVDLRVDLPVGPVGHQPGVFEVGEQPPVLVVSGRSPQTAPGYIFASPYAGPGKPGPEIFDEAGNLVWFRPMPLRTEAANLQVIADPRAIRTTYKQVVQEFINDMRKQCRDNTIDYQVISTATPLDQALASYLSWRG